MVFLADAGPLLEPLVVPVPPFLVTRAWTLTLVVYRDTTRQQGTDGSTSWDADAVLMVKNAFAR